MDYSSVPRRAIIGDNNNELAKAAIASDGVTLVFPAAP